MSERGRYRVPDLHAPSVRLAAMSNFGPDNDELFTCGNEPREDTIEILETKVAELGGAFTVRRAIPQRKRRLIGPWCFLDHFGPLEFQRRTEAMWVGQHPHIGLQTVTWLFDGEVIHRDSLGTTELIVPGGLNIMTAGLGISHTEETPLEHRGRLHGVQLWVALPKKHAEVQAAFENHANLPRFEDEGLHVVVFDGEGFGYHSPATAYSPMVGAELTIMRGGRWKLPLERDFEYGIVVASGALSVAGQTIEVGQFCYLKPGRSELILEAEGPVQAVLVGGVPFDEKIYIWWNFVGHSEEDIRAALADWEQGRRFGQVAGFDGSPMNAPPLVGRLK